MKIENTNLGQFTCSLEMFGQLLGLPPTTKIRHIEMCPYGMVGKQSVRVVVEDPETIPASDEGMEILNVSPKFRLNGKDHRQFLGWDVEYVQQDLE